VDAVNEREISGHWSACSGRMRNRAVMKIIGILALVRDQSRWG